jgi:hypothetical protein
MTMTAPTRITIEVHHPGSGEPQQPGAPIVRVVPHSQAMQPALEARLDAPTPPVYDPGPCLCLDDEDCGADHAND